MRYKILNLETDDTHSKSKFQVVNVGLINPDLKVVKEASGDPPVLQSLSLEKVNDSCLNALNHINELFLIAV